jgi:hypothetical protein
MPETAGIQENDVVVTKVGPQYWVWQQAGKSPQMLSQLTLHEASCWLQEACKANPVSSLAFRLSLPP